MYKTLLFCVVFVLFCACSNEKNQESKETRDFQSSSQASLDSEQPSLDDDTRVEVTIPQDLQSAETSTESSTGEEDAATLYARCAACHGKDGKSVAPGSVGGVLIASMNKTQVVESLKGFRSRTLSRGGNSVIMYMQAKNLSDADIEALAEYIDAF